VNNLPKVVTQQRRGRASNSRLLDRKSDALPLSHRATLWRWVVIEMTIIGLDPHSDPDQHRLLEGHPLPMSTIFDRHLLTCWRVILLTDRTNERLTERTITQLRQELNKKCGRRVRPTLYAPDRPLMTQVQHWAKAAQTDHVTLRP